MIRVALIGYFVWISFSSLLGLVNAVYHVLNSKRVEGEAAETFRKLAVLYFIWHPVDLIVGATIFWLWKTDVIDDWSALCYAAWAFSVIGTVGIIIKFRIKKIPFFPTPSNPA